VFDSAEVDVKEDIKEIKQLLLKMLDKGPYG